MDTDDIRPLVEQLEKMVLSVTSDRNINDSDLRRVLRFVSKIVQVVNQAFLNIYPILIEIKFLKMEDLQTGKLPEILKELELLNSRDYYRDIELICGQLKELSNQYKEQIEPIIHCLNINTRENFEQVFMLLEQHEGYIMFIIKEMTYKLRYSLTRINSPLKLEKVKKDVEKDAEKFRITLDELQVISNKILGISGKDGFLELTETNRLQIRDEINYSFNYIDKRIKTGNITGHQVAVGSNINQSIGQDDHSGLDAKEVYKLFEELINDIKSEGLPIESKGKIIKQLEVTKDELKEENPDKDYIGKNIQKATDTLKKAGMLIDQTSSIGQKLFKIGRWIGTVISLI
jgi:hypothetical protein